MIGTRWVAHSRTTSCTSSVVCGNTTASGGWLGSHVVVLACCSRTASEVTSRLPNRAASSDTAASTAFGVGRVTGAAERAGMAVLNVNTATLEHIPFPWNRDVL